MIYGSEEATLVTHVDVNIGSLFTKHVLDKTRFSLIYQVYVVIAIKTNANIIIHVHRPSSSLQKLLQDKTVISSLIYLSLINAHT